MYVFLAWLSIRKRPGGGWPSGRKRQLLFLNRKNSDLILIFCLMEYLFIPENDRSGAGCAGPDDYSGIAKITMRFQSLVS